MNRFQSLFTVEIADKLRRGRRYKIYHFSLNLFLYYLRKFECSIYYIHAAVIQFRSGEKSAINNKYLKNMVSFHSHVYADLLQHDCV